VNLIDKTILKLIQHKVSRWFDLERSLTEVAGSYGAIEGSPEKTWPDPEKIPLGNEVPFSLKNICVVGLHLRSSIRQGVRTIESLRDNPRHPKTMIDAGALRDFEEHARSLGIGAIGYAHLPRELIFKERAVLYDKAIVLLKEMDKGNISKAPSIATFKTVFETYDSLGKIVNILAADLRQKGYGVQAGHPLGGLVLYPPLAALAGLGCMGRHGLLITPQFGPRQRIGALFTGIVNLPFADNNPYAWIENFCQKCGRCIRTCPPKAILETPVVHGSGRKTHIVREKCLPVFVNQQGCTVCIKECSFTRRTYEDIRQSFVPYSRNDVNRIS
jgi:epoxyqueuosine reductase